MRTLKLARVAWEAEELHLRRVARSRVLQMGFAIAAAVIGTILLIVLHFVAFHALEPTRGRLEAALWIAGGDLVVLLILVFLAIRAGRDPVAEEAVKVRQQALRQIGDTAERAMVLAPLLRSIGGRGGLLGAAAAAAMVGLLSRR